MRMIITNMGARRVQARFLNHALDGPRQSPQKFYTKLFTP
jgi:hypothetical protein